MEKELPMYYKVGLNDSEVQERIAKGQVNGVSKPVSKSYGQIIKDNVCTLFNLLNFLIFVALVFDSGLVKFSFYGNYCYQLSYWNLARSKGKKTSRSIINFN